MATIPQILGKKWVGAEWEIEEDNYSTLEWFSSSPPKPTEQEIRIFSGEVDTLLAAEAKAALQRKLLDQGDSILQALEILADAVADIQAKARVTSPLTTSNLNKITTLATKLAQIRSQ